MSLFKTRDWWSTTAGEDEEFDQGCLCVANVDNNANRLDKIVLGSYHGILRIYSPSPSKTESGGWSGYRPQDVLFETQLSQPILQIEAGKFVSGSDNLHLAILHPRKLVVYGISSLTGAVDHGNQYQLNINYEHNLQRTAFCFCYGPFGGVKSKDFICVQSMDCTLSIFEQEGFSFSRFLPGSLLPGPLKYIAKTDSFVTVSSTRHVESYKYQVLAVATDNRSKEESQNIKSGKKVAADWTFNAGEQALDIAVVSSRVYVLGERNLFCLIENGKLFFMKKFEFTPSSFCPFYTSGDETVVRYMVATHTKTLMIYEDVTLKWAAQLNYIPVQIKTGNFRGLQGVITTLDDRGHLDCSYLGTDPSVFVAPASESREMDYANQDTEMKDLSRAIKEAQNKSSPIEIPQIHSDGFVPSVKSEDEIQISVDIPRHLDEISEALQSPIHQHRPLMVDGEPSIEYQDNPLYYLWSTYETRRAQGDIIQDEDVIPSLTLTVMIKAKAHVSNVVVSIHVPPPLTVNESSFTFNTISPNTPCEISATFYIKDNYLPSDMVAKATATYQNMAGAPRVSQTTFRLPAKLVIKACAPIKNANYKVTIDTNKPPVNLNDLFPDLLGDYADGPGNALGFQYYGGPVVTMLASKTSQRYRLQCDSFEPMWLLANELVNRLSGYFKGKNQDGFQASYSGALPLHEYFEVLEQHFEVRSNQNKYKDLLAQRASQFRAIQRRLLTRFKDKTPTPLSNLDTLLDGTYRQLLALADAAEENVRNLARVSSSLSAATYLLNLLIRLWTNMSDKEFYVLQSSLCPQVNDSEDQGWEEMVDCAITHLLRTCLAKNSKDQAINPSPLTPPKDTQKLKKHIALLCDKLSKGAKLVIEGLPQDIDTSLPGPAPILQADKNPPKKKKSQPMLADDIVDDGTNLGEAAVPIGSKFGEIKSPRNKKPKKKKPAPEEEVSPLAGPSDGLLDLGNLPPIPGGNQLGDGFRELQKQQKIRNNVPDLDDLDSEQPPPYQSTPPPYEDENPLTNGNSHGTGEKLYSL